jgi:predicted RND superfamily exporter protein
MYFPVASNILLPESIVTIERLQDMGYSDVMNRYLHKEGNDYELLTYIFYSSKAYDKEILDRAVDKLSELPLVKEGRVKLVGTPIFWREVTDIISKNIRLIFISAVLIILGILFLYFRDMRAALLALVPVFFSVVAMLGVFKVLGYKLDNFNSMWIALILGIGIDDGVHIISRYQSTRGDPSEALGEVGRAIIMTTLTTLVAFGSMTMAEFPGIRSSGVLAGSGMIFALIASLVILPALMKLFLGRRLLQGV